MTDSVSALLQQWAQVRPDLDVSPMGVVGRLSRASRLTERRVAQVMESHGLGPGEFDVLATLRRSGDPYTLTPGGLTRSAMVTSGAVTARLNRLESKGLLTRRLNPDSRRSMLVTLTAEGVALVDEVVEEHVENERQVLDGLSPREQKQLAALLEKLLVSLGDVPGVEAPGR